MVIYGKNIRLYDCDEYTREFYQVLEIFKNQNLGSPQPAGTEAG
jgi:hypothetical protein